MLRGHNRAVPARMVALHGSPGDKPPLIAEEPEGVGDLWAPPAWMDDDQREQWHYGVEHCPLGILTATDRETMVAWVVAAVEHARAAQELSRVGQIVQGQKGPKLNPAFGAMERAAMSMMRAGDRMGFSPMARAALGRAGVLTPATLKRGQIGSKLAAYLESKPDQLDVDEII